MFSPFGRHPGPVAGDAAPPFVLPTHDGRSLALVSFRGQARVVVAFYPEDDTRACTASLGTFEAARPRFAALNTQIVAISHNTAASQAKFAAKVGLGFPLLSDPKGDVARLYGTKGWLTYFFRRTFVVDGRGVLRYVHDGMPEVEKLIMLLDGLRGDLSPAAKGAERNDNGG